MTEAVRLGFQSPTVARLGEVELGSQDDADAEGEYATLAIAWRAEIAKRRQSAGGVQP